MAASEKNAANPFVKNRRQPEEIEPEMHITPDAQTIDKLDALREAGESYSDLVRRLAEEQIAERHAHGNAVFYVKLVPDLRKAIDTIRWAGESHADAIIRMVESYQRADDVRVGDLTPNLWEKLDTIRGEEEAYVNVIYRLLDEHMVRVAQQSMTPLGSTTAMRVKPATAERVSNMSRPGETYDDVIVRIIYERVAYRMVAMDMTDEGKRLLENQDAIITNFKGMLRELLMVDNVVAHEKSVILGEDVDVLADNLMRDLPDEGDDE